MAKDRTTICKHYICEGTCKYPTRTAEFSGYCQRCDRYQARSREHHVNMKKMELDKVREKEAKEEY